MIKRSLILLIVLLALSVVFISIHNGHKKVPCGRKVTMQDWIEAIASEREIICEPVPGIRFNRHLNEVEEFYPDYNINGVSFLDFYKNLGSVSDVKQLSSDTSWIKKFLQRRKPLIILLPNKSISFPRGLYIGSRMGGSPGGHPPHDILKLLKLNLVQALSNSKDYSYTKIVANELPYYSELPDCCRPCELSEKFVNYVNSVCPVCNAMIKCLHIESLATRF